MEKLGAAQASHNIYGNFQKVSYEKLILKGEQYTDEEFKPDISSLTHPADFTGSQIASATKKMWRDKVSWKRISDLFPSAIVYKDNSKDYDMKEFSPDDVVSGVFSQSYLHTCMKKIATDASMAIKKLFITKDINSVGVYVLDIYVDGSPKTVTIDDYIPYFESSKQPAFINTNTNCIWALLLEKAWAKV